MNKTKTNQVLRAIRKTARKTSRKGWSNSCLAPFASWQHVSMCSFMVRFLRFARNGLRAARPRVQERLRKSFLARCPNSYSVFSTQGGSSFQLRSLHQHSLSETCVPCSHPCFYRLASDSIFEVLLRSFPQWSGTFPCFGWHFWVSKSPSFSAELVPDLFGPDRALQRRIVPDLLGPGGLSLRTCRSRHRSTKAFWLVGGV